VHDEHQLEAKSGELRQMADTINDVGTTQRPVSSRSERYLRLHDPHLHLAAPFGSDWFGRKAEAFARLFGTPTFLITQTAIVVVWIALNALLVAFRWDPYPFILLNLAFSTQAAYAAPLILLAQTRQADRDKALAIADAEHRDAVAGENLRWQDRAAVQAEQHRLLLESNTRLTEQSKLLGEHLEELMREIHARICD
jgi:uncharacterized membrane protein